MATFEEQYMLNYFDSLYLLQTEQRRLERAAVSAKLSDAERAAAAAAYLDFASQIGMFIAAHEALMKKFAAGGVRPPGQELVDRTADLERELGEILATRQKYSAMLQSITGVITAWASLSPARAMQGAAAPTDPALREAPLTALAASSNLAFIGKA